MFSRIRLSRSAFQRAAVCLLGATLAGGLPDRTPRYAHARICSILRKTDDLDAARVDPTAALEPAERALLLAIDDYTTALAEVAATLEPHRLANYLYDLARTFTSFYDTCPVLTAAEPARGNRIAICQLTARTLAHGLDLLGIKAPERL